MGIMDKKDQASLPKGYGTSAKAPKASNASDSSGERKEGKRGGVAMGKEDKIGKDSQYNTGRTEGVCYTHSRDEYK